MIYGYARVSTKGQARDGNSLEGQKKELMVAGVSENNIYQDAFTGTRMDRPELAKLMEKLQSGDTLVVTKLDRLSRSVSQASELITNLIDKDITVNVLAVGIMSNDSVNTLMRNVLLSFAQFEKDMIVQRTQEGKAIAKLNNPNFHEGRPKKWSKIQMDHAMELLETHSFTETTKLTGISRSSLLREKKLRNSDM